ncbi:hypothetical protein SAMN06265795_10113 [Noviherbaspirillum humi]|uniref:Lipoprotein n=1 Tax=Noviherbaspirillum humi TaxID=1688639 RepID=A0A239BPH0_9BURK|nr:hypothetical protein SAMN06265795_10113 [Noviherbaspirillum humi]
MTQDSITQAFRSWIARSGLLLLAVLLAGCSALRLGYSNGETVSYWWLNGYVDFESSQQPWVKKHIDNFFAWHRKTQLPDYAQLLGKAQQQVQRPATEADALAYYDAFRKRMLTVVDHVLPDLAELALSLQPQQIAHLEGKFASNNENYRKEYLRGDVDQRQRNRFKKVMKQAEYWFGSFSSEQESQIRTLSDARPLDNEVGLEERVRRQEEMVAMLRRIHDEKPAKEAAMRMIRDYVDRSFNYFGDTRHKTFSDAATKANAGMLAAIVNLATPEQKAHAARRLQQWIDDCHNLAARD